MAPDRQAVDEGSDELQACRRQPALPACLLGPVLSLAVLPAAASAGEMDDAEAPSATIVVTGHREDDANPNANPEAPYKVEKSQNGKFTEKLRDTPKTVIAIPKEVIEAIGATSFREVVRATPGVTLGTGEGGNAFGDRIFIRGFEARNDVYIDGLRDPGVTSREIFAVEQIEVIKGPSGNFGGRGTTGGLVSLESKRPQFGNSFIKGEAGIGTENFYRATLDGNYAFSDRFAMRINGLFHDSDTPGRDHVGAQRYGATIAMAWKMTGAITFSGDYYHFRLDGIPDFGHPFDVVTQRPYAVDGDNFYGVIGRDFLKNGADIGTFRIDVAASDAVSIRSVTRAGRTYNNYIAGTPGAVCRVARTAAGACPAGGASAPPTGTDAGLANYTIAAGGQRRWGDNNYTANVTDMTARFNTGAISHTLVVGGEYAHERVETLPLTVAAFTEDAAGNVISTPTTYVRNLLNPDPVLGFTVPVGPDRTNGPTRVKVESLSAYLIDTIKFSPQIWATLGGRYDRYDLDYRSSDLASATILANKVGFWNWQASLTWKPAEALTFYGSFATSSNPSGEQLDGNGIAYDGIAAQTQNLDPERNTGWEAGAKWETPDGKLLVSAALFQIVKANARENIGGNVYELAGKLRSRGFELGVNGTLFDKLQLFGGYTYTDARIVESATATNVGRPFANIPRHTASLLATWLVSSNFEIGGQAHVQSKVFGGTLAAGSAHYPGFARFDAVVRWKPMPWLETRLNVNNLADKRYYDAIYRSGAPFAYVAPGRSAVLTLAVKY